MKLLIATLVTVLGFSIPAFSQMTHMVCLTGHVVDMDLHIQSFPDGRETLYISLTDMDGMTVRTFLNSEFTGHQLSKGLNAGPIDAILYLSDIKRGLEGNHFNAGLVKIIPKNRKFEVTFAAEGNVYTGSCAIVKN